MNKKVKVIVFDEDNTPITPQLVPVTIQWVEADRAYRLTFWITFTVVLAAGALLACHVPPDVVLGSTLAGLILQAAARGYSRYTSRRDLDAMRRQLGIKD